MRHGCLAPCPKSCQTSQQRKRCHTPDTVTPTWGLTQQLRSVRSSTDFLQACADSSTLATLAQMHYTNVQVDVPGNVFTSGVQHCAPWTLPLDISAQQVLPNISAHQADAAPGANGRSRRMPSSGYASCRPSAADTSKHSTALHCRVLPDARNPQRRVIDFIDFLPQQ